MREPTPLLLVFESEMIENHQIMSWSQTIVNTGYLAEKHTISGCGSSSNSRKPASGSLCSCNTKWKDGKCL